MAKRHDQGNLGEKAFTLGRVDPEGQTLVGGKGAGSRQNSAGAVPISVELRVHILFHNPSDRGGGQGGSTESCPLLLRSYIE